MLFDQIASNKRKKPGFLLLVFFLLLALVGYAVGYLFMRSGLGGMIIAFDYRPYLRSDHDLSIDRDCHVYEWGARLMSKQHQTSTM